MAMTRLYGDLPQLLSSLYVYGLSHEQIKSLQAAGEVPLSQAIISSQTPLDLIPLKRNTLYCNYIYYFL